MRDHPNITAYISCACNKAPHMADWGRNELICYGACNAVTIYDPKVKKIGKIQQTLHRHKGRINTVRWIKSRNTALESEILSGSTDGTAIIWSQINTNFEPTSVINVGKIVTIANSFCLTENTYDDGGHFSQLLICIGTTDDEITLWLRERNGEVKPFQTLNLEKKLPIECCCLHLPNSDIPLLAIAVEDSSIQLFCQETDKARFVKVQILYGHEDWIRCMDFCCDKDDSILLASASQDATIRLWRISQNMKESPQKVLQQKKHIFASNNVEYSVTLESVLCGHEGWIYGLQWQPFELKDDIRYQPLKLLSCSLDKSMIIWEPDIATGIWTETVRVGEVGGNSLGFYGCKFGPHGLSILAHGFQGSFHIWKYSSEINNWMPAPALGGHFAEVVDLCWEPQGRFFITVSTDQTTRVHGFLKYESEEMWHEIGRPQVHGYDLSCLAILTPYMFASGAEEKVVRIFIAPETFKNHLAKIADIDDFENTTVESASVPALGLTNKGIINVNKLKHNKSVSSKDEDYVPLTEEDLMQNTLWPELQKLYGHGYEIFSMAAKHDGSLLATACKSTSQEHSAIILWDTEKWCMVQQLISHQLTVTQMAFSPDDKFLISVSRDRRWSLFECKNNEYILVAASSKKDSLHSRIIWCCTWSHDSKYFVTGSRDGKIGIWVANTKREKDIIPKTSVDTNGVSVTAVALAPFERDCCYILAAGYESGEIEIYKLILKEEGCTWQKCLTYNTSQAHHLTVKKLMFRPQTKYQSDTLQLASCGLDHIVKLYNIHMSQL